MRTCETPHRKEPELRIETGGVQQKQLATAPPCHPELHNQIDRSTGHLFAFLNNLLFDGSIDGTIFVGATKTENKYFIINVQEQRVLKPKKNPLEQKCLQGNMDYSLRNQKYLFMKVYCYH